MKTTMMRKTRKSLLTIAVVCAAVSFAGAAPIVLLEDGVMGAGVTYLASSPGTVTTGQNIGGEDCVKVELPANNDYVRWTGPSATTFGANTTFSITIYVEAQTGDQGIAEIKPKMSDNNDVLIQDLDWYPTAEQWTTFTSDVTQWSGYSDTWGPNRMLIYNDGQNSGTTFYIKDMMFVDPIPEPGSLGLLALGALGLQRIRRRSR
jgi:hypothetical protein